MKRSVLLPSLTIMLLAGGYPAVESVLAQSPSPAATQAADWQDFAPVGEGFTIEMPPGSLREEVQPMQTELGPIDLHMVGIDQQTRVFAIMYNDFPDAFEAVPPDTLLEGTMQGLMTNVSQRLNPDRNLSISGYPGVDLHYQGVDGLVYKHRIYLVDKRLYQVIAATSQENQTGFVVDADRFLNSFDLTESSLTIEN